MKKNFVASFMIITFFNTADRVLGFLFKIFLSRKLGAESMGIYQIATSVFFVFLTFITSGLPLVVSKRVARFVACKDTESAGKTTSAALLISLITALSLSLFTLVFIKPLRFFVGNDQAVTLILILLPALIFSAIYSSLRGWLWGCEKFFAVSLVEVIEQVFRIGSCIALFALGCNALNSTAAATSIGCLVSAIACVLFFIYYKGKLAAPNGQIKPLLLSELPITSSRAASSLIGSVIAILVPDFLIASGHSQSSAYELFGAASGMAMPLLFTPMTIIGSLSFILIPSIGALNDSGKTDGINRRTESAIAFSSAVACLFIPLFSECGKQIGMIVYGNAVSGEFMSMSAWLLLPLSLEAITSSIMNSLDLEMKSFINSLIGFAAQIGFYLCFKQSFTLQIYAIGTGLSLCLSQILHLIAVTKKTGLGAKHLLSTLKCLLACAPCCLLTKSMLGITSALSPLLSVIISGSLGMLAFIALCLVFGCVDISLLITKRPRKPVSNKKIPANC